MDDTKAMPRPRLMSGVNTYTVVFSSIILDVSTTVMVDDDGTMDEEELEERAIDLAEERINGELGTDYVSYCHSVNVELYSRIDM